mmetsp:Transcript_37351/g.106697  ORF Transcript_37351/g.106697 Transcript_37351/m.106697 type:complete len:288 (-) Transcript_37351:749-1612(-)
MRLVGVQQHEKLEGFVDRQLHGVKVRLHLHVLQMIFKLGQRDRPSVIGVDALEDAREALHELLLGRKKLLDHHVRVHARALNGGLAEHSRHHIEHSKVGERDEGYKQQHPKPAQGEMRQWISNILPVHATAHGLEQREDRLPERPIIPLQVRDLPQVGWRKKMLAGSLREQDAEDIQDDEEQTNCPKQGPQRVDYRVDQNPQGAEAPHDTYQTQKADAPDYSEHADGVEGTGGGVSPEGIQHELNQGAQDNDTVEQVPPPRRGTTKATSLCHNSHEELKHIRQHVGI